MKPFIAAISAAAALASGASANIVITQDNNAANLANAILGGFGGINIVNATLNGHTSGGAMSSGTYTTTGATNTYGMFTSQFMQSGIVLSSGNVSDYETGPNTAINTTTSYGVIANAAQTALLVPIAGAATYFDATELIIEFTVNQDTGLFFQAVFGSEEYPEWVGSTFIDGFGLYLNGNNIAFVNGMPVNIDHPNMAAVAGTELDGVLTNTDDGSVINSFQGVAFSNQLNVLHIIIADRSDANLDTTVYLGGFQVPAPGALALLGLAGLVGRRRRRE